MEQETAQKECGQCGQMKLLDEYYSRMRVFKKGVTTSYSRACRECQKEQAKEGLRQKRAQAAAIEEGKK